MFEIEYELKDGTLLVVSFDAEFEAEDIGIGAYEYWGARGVDKHIVNTCTDVELVSAEDENGKDYLDSLDKETLRAITDACEEYANDNAPEPSSGRGEDYDDPRNYD